MPTTLDDLISDLGNQSGSQQLKGTRNLQDNLEKLADAMDGDSHIARATKQLAASLEAITDQATINIQKTKKALQKRAITEKAANAAIKRQIKVISEVSDEIEKEAKSRNLGTKDLNKFNKLTEIVNEGLRDEVELLEKKKKQERSWMLEQKVRRAAEKRDREVERQRLANARKEEAKDFFGSLEGHLGGGFGAGVLGAARNRAAQTGGRGAKGRVAALGAMGVGAAVVHHFGKVQSKALDTMTARATNYNTKWSDINKEIKTAAKNVKDVETAAIRLGMSEEEFVGALRDISAATGQTTSALLPAIVGREDGNGNPTQLGIMQLVHAQVGSLGELSEMLTHQINTVGKSANAGIKTMGAMASMSRTSVFHMDDFFRSVREVSGSVGALTTNQETLGKSMIALTRNGAKLKLSYDRQTKAAQGLTTAVTANFDEGFSMLNVRDELAIGAKSKDSAVARSSQAILANLNAGVLDVQTAAKQFKEAGGTQDQGVIEFRMEQVARSLMGGGSSRKANLLLGKEMTVDELGIMQELSAKMKEGKSFGAAMDEVKTGAGGQRLREFTKKIGDRRKTGGNETKAALKELENAVTDLIIPHLGDIADALKNISISVKWIAKKFGAPTPEEKKKEKKLESINDGRGTLIQMLTRLGEKQGFTEKGSEFVQRLRGNEGLQERFRSKFKRGTMGAEGMALRDSFRKAGMKESEILQLLMKLAPEGSPAMQSLKLEASRMKTRPDGKAVMRVSGEIVDPQGAVPPDVRNENGKEQGRQGR